MLATDAETDKSTMKAACYHRYGGPEQLALEEVETPAIGERDILVRVSHVSLNASDVEFLRAKPAYVRAWGPLRPKVKILGSDVAGTVVGVGSKTTRFKPGDRVVGDLLEHWRGLAEHVAAPERLWAAIPPTLTNEVACMLPQAGAVAAQAVAACGDIANKHILINGAGGGSGTLAIQVARMSGAGRITAVDRAEKADVMRRLGAHEVIDFTREDYTVHHSRYDAIIDLVGSRGVAANARALTPRGRYLLVGGPVPRLLTTLLFGKCWSLVGSRQVRLLVVKQSPEAIGEVATWCVDGKVTPILGSSFPLHEVQAAFRALCDGTVSGKVVIHIEH